MLGVIFLFEVKTASRVCARIPIFARPFRPLLTLLCYVDHARYRFFPHRTRT